MDELRKLIAERLLQQGITGTSAITGSQLNLELVEAVLDCCLSWLPLPGEVMHIAQPFHVDAVVGFAFGNRFVPHGNLIAGSVNEKLAYLLIDYYKALRSVCPTVPVWVQWEIGDYIPSAAVPTTSITKLEPGSTIDAMKRVAADLEKSDLKEGAKILVVAQPDHLRRCMKIVRSFHYIPFAVHHIAPDSPDWYDPQSGQLWTRTRHLYLLHDMIGQLNAHRESRNAGAKAVGLW